MDLRFSTRSSSCMNLTLSANCPIVLGNSSLLIDCCSLLVNCDVSTTVTAKLKANENEPHAYFTGTKPFYVICLVTLQNMAVISL